MIQWLSKESFYFMPSTDPQIQLALVLRQRQFESETNLKCSLELMNEALDILGYHQNKPSNLSSAIDMIFSISNQQLMDAFKQIEPTPLISAYAR